MSKETLDSTAKVLYEEMFRDFIVPMPHWQDLPRASKRKIHGILLRVLNHYGYSIKSEELKEGLG